jgi:hypothetical protein
MASFTDRIPTFNPYVSQQPVQAMVQVGMAKQQQYDQNLQRIQQSMANVAGLDIARGVDRDYLENKMNDMSKQLSTFASSDLSSSNLTNKLKGMITGVADDEIVRTAVASTQKYKDELSFIEKEREAGDLTQDNYYHFQKQAQSWFDDPNQGTAFRGQYVKHFDVLDYARETFDSIKPDGKVWDELFSGVDANGNPVMSAAMKKMKQEGIFPEKAARVIDQIMSEGRVKQQLQITGEYNYRGMDSESLKNNIVASRDATVSFLDKSMDNLKIRKAAGEDVDQELSSLIDQREDVLTRSAEQENLAFSDPDSVRGNLHTANTRLNYQKMFTNVKTSDEYIKNPVWWGNFEVQKEANTQARHRDVLRQNKLEFAWEQQMDVAGLDMERYKADLAAGKLAGAGANPDAPTDPGTQTGQKEFDVLAFEKAQYQKAEQDYTKSSTDLIWEALFREEHYNELAALLKKNPNMDPTAAKNSIIEKAAASNPEYMTDVDLGGGWSMGGGADIDKYKADKLTQISGMAGVADPNSTLAKMYADYHPKKVYYEYEKAEMDAQTKLWEDELKAVGVNITQPEVINVGGEDYTIEPDDILDFAAWRENRGLGISQYFSDDAEEKYNLSKRAEARLRKKYPKEVVDKVGSMMIQRQTEEVMDYSTLTPKPGLQTKLWELEAQIREADMGGIREKREERAKARLGVDPNQTFSVFGGNTEFNEGQRRKIQKQISAYVGTGGDPQNLADKDKFEKLIKSLGDEENFKALDLNMTMSTDANGEKRAYLHNIKNDAGAYISWKDAVELRPDLATKFAPEDVKRVNTIMRSNNGTTSKGDPAAVSTYVNGGAHFQNFQFPGMVGSESLFVQGNLEEDPTTGMITPYLYIKQHTPDGNNYHDVFRMNAVPNVETALKLFKDPTTINPIRVTQMIMKAQKNKAQQ